jgi:hypothetical protein
MDSTLKFEHNYAFTKRRKEGSVGIFFFFFLLYSPIYSDYIPPITFLFLYEYACEIRYLMRLSSLSFSPRWEKGHFAFWSFCFVVLFYSPCIFSIGVFGCYLFCLLAFFSSISNSSYSYFLKSKP